ncbi:MAG: hypothetical protein JW888_02165, partial [Pirellulales bacterium]|nr:hypothetical protein [Pirellulales bacterium]
ASTAATLNSLHLATGKLINYPSDNPTKFIQIAAFQSRLDTVSTTMNNVTQAGSLVSQAGTALSSMQSLLEDIRDVLETDEDRSLTPAERLEAQAQIDEYLEDFAALVNTTTDGKKLLDGSANYNIEGRNASQVSDVRILKTAADGPIVAAEPARLTYTGTDRYAAAAATIQITGNYGTSGNIAITTNDTLEDIAAAINAETGLTNVLAYVDDNTLTIESVGSGAGSKVIVNTIAGTFTTSGGSAPGVAYGTAEVEGDTPAISGYVTQAATQAELVYTGSGSNPGANAAVTITGSLGSTSISVLTTDTIDETATKFNDVSHITGVTAAVSTVGANEVITFTSVEYGTDATIDITVASGTFDVTGGNGDGTANGTNAIAVINGKTYSGATAATNAELKHREKTANFASNADFDLTGYIGTRSYEARTTKTLDDLADEINAESDLTGVVAIVDDNDLIFRSTITGDDALVTINTTVGTFDTVSGDTTSSGADAVDGSTNVQGNRFLIDDNGFRFEITFAPDFTGTFDSISIDGGGMTFALSTDLNYRSTLAIPGLQPEIIGGLSGTLSQLATGGTYSGLDGNTSQAIRIVDEAMGDLVRAKGAVDGFYNAQVTSASNLLADMEEDLETAITQTDGYNEEEETILLTKNEELVQNAISSLVILNQQRSSLVTMLKQIAGLI